VPAIYTWRDVTAPPRSSRSAAILAAFLPFALPEISTGMVAVILKLFSIRHYTQLSKLFSHAKHAQTPLGLRARSGQR
jgi:hypothetical protein